MGFNSGFKGLKVIRNPSEDITYTRSRHFPKHAIPYYVQSCNPEADEVCPRLTNRHFNIIPRPWHICSHS